MSAIGHPGERYLQMLVGYGHSKNVLSGNTCELQRFVSEMETGKLKELYDSSEFRDKMFSMNGHLLRYTHNFLSAHMTYVSHVRVLMKSALIRPLHLERYREKIKATFNADPITRFTQDFRNYILHYGLPSLAHVSSSNSPDQHLTVFVELDKLQEWDGWKEQSRQFIKTYYPSMRLLWFLHEHEKLMTAFNEWFAMEFYKEYRPEMEDFEKHHQKLFAERFKTPNWPPKDEKSS